MKAQIKTIGTNGQLSLGKQFAGMMVLVEKIEDGTWLIKTGNFVPDSEKWLHEGDNMKSLDRALAWSERNPPIDNFEEQLKKLQEQIKELGRDGKNNH